MISTVGFAQLPLQPLVQYLISLILPQENSCRTMRHMVGDGASSAAEVGRFGGVSKKSVRRATRESE